MKNDQFDAVLEYQVFLSRIESREGLTDLFRSWYAGIKAKQAVVEVLEALREESTSTAMTLLDNYLEDYGDAI